MPGEPTWTGPENHLEELLRWYPQPDTVLYSLQELQWQDAASPSSIDAKDSNTRSGGVNLDDYLLMRLHATNEAAANLIDPGIIDTTFAENFNAVFTDDMSAR